MLDMSPRPARTNGLNGGHSAPSRPRKRARPAADRAPALLGWLSSDAEEIERRRWRGRTEVGQIEPLEPDQPYFGSFRVRSGSGGSYDVEIRSLDQTLNSCGCADHRVNGLGTCKHIEGVLARLRKRGVRAFAAAQRLGIAAGRVVPAPHGRQRAPAPLAGGPDDGGCGPRGPGAVPGGRRGDRDTAPDGIAALLRALAEADPPVRQQLRVSGHLDPGSPMRGGATARAGPGAFLAEVDAGTQTIDLLRHPLLPYQREGMLHLAFGERALLADDMGLGKTIQAIAAAELLRRLHGIARVLVVCPASLKGEWQEQIARFSGAPTLLVTGSRAGSGSRSTPSRRFFTVVNYEQVRHRRRRHQPHCCGPTSSSSTRRSASRTGRPRRRAR